MGFFCYPRRFFSSELNYMIFFTGHEFIFNCNVIDNRYRLKWSLKILLLLFNNSLETQTVSLLSCVLFVADALSAQRPRVSPYLFNIWVCVCVCVCEDVFSSQRFTFRSHWCCIATPVTSQTWSRHSTSLPLCLSVSVAPVFIPAFRKENNDLKHLRLFWHDDTFLSGCCKVSVVFTPHFLVLKHCPPSSLSATLTSSSSVRSWCRSTSTWSRSWRPRRSRPISSALSWRTRTPRSRGSKPRYAWARPHLRAHAYINPHALSRTRSDGADQKRAAASELTGEHWSPEITMCVAQRGSSDCRSTTSSSWHEMSVFMFWASKVAPWIF